MTSVARTKNFLRSSFGKSLREGYRAVNDVRLTHAPSHFEAIVKHLKVQPRAQSLCSSANSNLDNIFRGHLLDRLPLETELNWCLSVPSWRDRHLKRCMRGFKEPCMNMRGGTGMR